MALRILAISGSLRAASSNTTLLRAAAALAPAEVTITLYERLGDLPHFNPDLDTEAGPEPVLDFRAKLVAADAVLICSPEYAHGVPGVLKNALDWVVGSGELEGKPVALLNASSRATIAQASLMETLRTMSANLVAEACATIPLTGKNLDTTGIVADVQLAEIISVALATFIKAIQ